MRRVAFTASPHLDPLARAGLHRARLKAFIVVLVGADPFPDENGVGELADGAIVVANTC